MIEEILGYKVERKKVKNINLRIKDDFSIYISAPYNLDIYYIEQFIISKKKFIDNTINKFREYRKNLVEETLENNTKFKLLGSYFKLNVNNSTYDKIYIDNENNTITINSVNDDYFYKKKIMDKFLYKLAEKIFYERFNKYLYIMDEKVNKLIIKEIKGKWGYCEVNKKIIALNTKLIKRSLNEIDYVIIHEIAHLRYPNHSKNFYRHIEKYMKDYKMIENRLKYK